MFPRVLKGNGDARSVREVEKMFHKNKHSSDGSSPPFFLPRRSSIPLESSPPHPELISPSHFSATSTKSPWTKSQNTKPPLPPPMSSLGAKMTESPPLPADLEISSRPVVHKINGDPPATSQRVFVTGGILLGQESSGHESHRAPYLWKNPHAPPNKTKAEALERDILMADLFGERDASAEPESRLSSELTSRFGARSFRSQMRRSLTII